MYRIDDPGIDDPARTTYAIKPASIMDAGFIAYGSCFQGVRTIQRNTF